jgi:hypothetical protein
MIPIIVRFLFLTLLTVGMLLPSDGNHGFFTPKSLAFLGSGFSFVFYFISRPHLNIKQAYLSVFLLFSLVFFAFFAAVGIDQNPQLPSGQFGQFKVFITTLFVPLAGLYLVEEGLLTPQKIFKTLIFAGGLYALIKLSLIALHMVGVLNLWKVLEATGIRFMRMHIVGSLDRLQTSVDIATPYFVYFVLQSEPLGLDLSPAFKRGYLAVTAISTFFSFSRLLLFAYVLSVVLYVVSLPLFRQIKGWIFLGALMLMGIAAIGPAKVGQMVEKRFFSHATYHSDAARDFQVNAIMKACDEAPLLGKGLGGYTEECVRDPSLLHAYEVQWLAFLMQFGALGFLLIALPAAYIGFTLLTPPVTILKTGFFLLFSLWLVSGFTNPFLISLASGIIYLSFLLVPLALEPKDYSEGGNCILSERR